MLIKNDAKGSFGAFSNMGRTTVISFMNIKKKDSLLNPKNNKDNKNAIIDFLKRNKYNNIEGDLSIQEIKDDENFEEDSQSEEPTDEHDIFDIKQIKNKNKTKSIKRGPHTLYHKTNIEAYKYHDLNMTKKKIKKQFLTPNCTKYFPKKDFVWHRNPTCLKWDSMQKRKPLYNKLNEGKLLEHDDPLKNIKNCFVNMEKQTMRGDSMKYNNVRVQTAKPFKKDEIRLRNKKRKSRNKTQRIQTGNLRNYNKELKTENTVDSNKYNIDNQKQVTTELTDETNTNINNINNIITTSNNKSNTIYEEQKNNNTNNFLQKTKELNMDESSSEFNDSYQKYKNYYSKQLKFNIKTEANEKQENVENEKQNYPMMKTENNESNIINKDNKRPKTGFIDNRNKIRGPEFDKIIPREYYDNLNDNGVKLIPFAVNNY